MLIYKAFEVAIEDRDGGDRELTVYANVWLSRDDWADIAIDEVVEAGNVIALGPREHKQTLAFLERRISENYPELVAEAEQEAADAACEAWGDR